MHIEIERKFLVTGNEWRDTPGVRIRQGYLNREPERTVRIRLAGGEAFLTIKGPSSGAARREFEYAIPVSHAQELLKMCDGRLIEKMRHRVGVSGLVWEVDEFLGDNLGLVIAEIELQHENQAFVRPAWLGREITHDPRYANANLCVHPFTSWEQSRQV
jgi:adenylate cyclase